MDVKLACIVTFGPKKELVFFRRGKLHDFVFNGWTVPGPARRDCPAIHRGPGDVVGDDLLSFRFEESDPARHLLRMPRFITTPPPVGPEVRPRVIELLDLAFLDLQLTEIDGATVDSWRRAGLKTRDSQARVLELLRQMGSCRLACSAAGDVSVGPDVNTAAQKGACCDDN